MNSWGLAGLLSVHGGHRQDDVVFVLLVLQDKLVSEHRRQQATTTTTTYLESKTRLNVLLLLHLDAARVAFDGHRGVGRSGSGGCCRGGHNNRDCSSCLKAKNISKETTNTEH